MQSLLVIVTIVMLVSVTHCEANDTQCDRITTRYGLVCKCTEDFCDYLTNPTIEKENQWILISSSKDGLRFSQSQGDFDSLGRASVKINDYNEYRLKSQSQNFNVDSIMVDSGKTRLKISGNGLKTFFQLSQQQSEPKSSSSATVTINRSNTFQHIVGFGGALTGAVAYLMENLKPKVQDHIYKSYFHQDGIAYNMLRTSIGGCDFDLQPWAYNEHPINDKILSNFTQLDKRDLVKIKQIKKIQSIMADKELKMMAAAWSPPPWMKTNDNWTGLSYLRTEFYETWAKYHLRYLELMKSQNISLWAISTGNEPLNGVIGWFFVKFMSLGWTPKNQAVFLSDYLGPLIKKSEFKDLLIFGNDDQRYTYPGWFEKMNASRPDSLNYLDGLAVHWYWDSIFSPTLIDNTLELMPGKILLNTESCVGDKPWQTHGPELGSWERGEQYINSYLQDMQHNFNGYIDWNLMLNEQGGPNYVHNYVDAAIVVNTTNFSEFYKQPIFYAIGHFSKFLTPNSKRIFSDSFSIDKTLNAVGFQRPDDTIVVMIFNGGSSAQDLTLSDSVRGLLKLNIPPRSIHTLLYK